ncbi:MAG: dipeptide epimerase [Longimicrobiales bacterium]
MMRLEHEILKLRTRHAFHIARAAGEAVRRTVFVRVIADDGTEGWGEAPVSTPYYGETADTVVALLPALEAALQDVVEREGEAALEAIEAALAGAVGYNPGARAAVSAALHDLLGKRLGVPVWRVLGLSARAPTSSFTIGIDEPEIMREKVRAAAGHSILKLKVGTSRDAEVLALVRAEAPDATLRIDANTAWTAEQALARLPLLEEHGVELLEQPLAPDDLDGLKRLRRRSGIPIVADESCRTAADIPRLVGAVDGINIKLAKCGSLREAVRMVHVARAHGLRVMLGCMIESTLGIAAAAQVAPLVDWLDLDGAALLAEDPFTGPGIGADGTLRLNAEPGLGVRRDGAGG